MIFESCVYLSWMICQYLWSFVEKVLKERMEIGIRRMWWMGGYCLV